MSNFPNQFGGQRTFGRAAGTPLDYESQADSLTVAQFFNMVYAWMCVGLALTAVVGYYVAHSSLAPMIYSSRGGIVVIALAAFAIAWYVQSQAGRLSVGVSTALFLLYAAVIGALISGIFIIYNARTLFAAFVLTGGTFGAMSVYGFVTKRDLSRMGSIFVMLAFGFIIASFVNMWLASDALSWVITYAILVLFIGITAYETQMLRNMAVQFGNNREMATRYAIVGSLVLYISFINLFLSILRILGSRR
jgi:FtsH-binding integral membrane protein